MSTECSILNISGAQDSLLNPLAFVQNLQYISYLGDIAVRMPDRRLVFECATCFSLFERSYLCCRLCQMCANSRKKETGWPTLPYGYLKIARPTHYQGSYPCLVFQKLQKLLTTNALCNEHRAIHSVISKWRVDLAPELITRPLAEFCLMNCRNRLPSHRSTSFNKIERMLKKQMLKPFALALFNSEMPKKFHASASINISTERHPRVA